MGKSPVGMLPVDIQFLSAFHMKVNMDSSNYGSLPSNTTLFAPLQIQVLSYFDNYLLASVILVALAITLIMLYISCYAWVFRGNLDLPKPTKAFSIKGRLDSFKPARRGGSNVKTFSNLISIQSGNPFYPIIKLTDLQSKLYPTIHLAC